MKTEKVLSIEEGNSIGEQYKKQGLDYMIGKDATESAFTSSILLFKKNEIRKLSSDIQKLHNVLKKVIFSTFKEQGIYFLNSLGFSNEMCKVIRSAYEKHSPYKELTFFGRYDVLLDKKDKPYVIECNAETPAGLPESRNGSPVFTKKYHNVNNAFDKMMEKSFSRVLKKMNNEVVAGGYYSNREYIVTVTYTPEFDEEKNEVKGEDYINAKRMAIFLADNLVGRRVVLAKIGELQIDWRGVFFEEKRVNDVWMFYPMEWVETDEGGSLFWEHYRNGLVNVMNNPLTLILQNKKFFAWIYDQMESNKLTCLNWFEKQLIKRLIPHTTSKKTEGYVKKPLLFREGVGIDNEEYSDECVYQKRIDQKTMKFDIFTAEEDMYLTLGVYVGETSAPIGMYNRASIYPITDQDAFYIQAFYK